MNEREGRRPSSPDEGLVGGSAYDAHGQAISDADMEKGHGGGCRAVSAPSGGPKWDAVPYEVAARSRPAAAQEGHGAVRQSAAGDLLSGAGELLLAQARKSSKVSIFLIVRELTGGRLFRRTQGDHRSRQWPEARHRHPVSTTRTMSEAHCRWRRLWNLPAPASTKVCSNGKAQRHEIPACCGTRW